MLCDWETQPTVWLELPEAGGLPSSYCYNPPVHFWYGTVGVGGNATNTFCTCNMVTCSWRYSLVAQKCKATI